MHESINYYSYYGDLTVEDYFTKRILNNNKEMERFYEVIENLPSDISSVFDVGCGPGIFLHTLQEKLNVNVLGLEITESKLKYAAKKMNVQGLMGDAGNLPIKTGSYDLTVALEVLEHLPHFTFRNAINEIQRISKKYIVISVPYSENRINISCPSCGCKFHPSLHLRSFNEKILLNLFENFSAVKIHRINEYYQLINPFGVFHQLFSKKPFPEFSMCPACGFTRNTDKNEVLNKKKSIYFIIKKLSFGLLPENKEYQWILFMKKWAIRLWPKRKKCQWIMGIYGRK